MTQNRKEYKKKYYQINKKRLGELKKKWREKNGRYYKKALSSWEGFIPNKTNCEVCGKLIFFNKRNPRIAIHFDHRNGNETIMNSPAIWLRQNKRTPEREKIWKRCDFGMLCENCNRSLPTKNRVPFLLNALKYCNRRFAQFFPMNL